MFQTIVPHLRKKKSSKFGETRIDCGAIKIPVLSVCGNYKAFPAQLSFIPAV